VLGWRKGESGPGKEDYFLFSLSRLIFMIKVTRLNGIEYYINPHQIESIETRPDTTLLMLSGKYVVVKEGVTEVIDRIVEYRRRIGAFKNEE
jgi:flagellar protein FlbD